MQLKRKFYWKRKREGKRNDFSKLGRRCKNDCEKFFAERNGKVKCNYAIDKENNGHRVYLDEI